MASAPPSSSSSCCPPLVEDDAKKCLIVDDAAIQRMKLLEQKQQGDTKRRRQLPPLVSSSSSLASLSSLESEASIKPYGSSWCDLPLTTTLPLLVFLDMFSVALVVPLLFRYYQSAGVTSAGQRELITSLFSVAQIVGGLVLGAMIEARWVKRRTVLYLSFAGSAFAYALLAVEGFAALLWSRILVGLVKQTMTITRTMLTGCTSEDNRAKYMGRLSASATAAWVLGPSVGAILFKFVDPRAPPILAAVLFLVNLAVATCLLPADDDNEVEFSSEDDADEEPNRRVSCPEQCQAVTYQATNKCQSCTISFVSNLKTCFSSSTLRSVVCATLVVTWVTRATNSNNLFSFYEDLYGLEPHHRGYISSYQQVLGFFIESCFIAPVLRWSGGERRATCVYTFAMAIVIGLQTLHPSSLTLFLGLVCPMTSLAYSVMFTSLQTLVTTVTPVDSIFSVLATLDILQNAVSVVVPLYRTFLFAKLTDGSRTTTLTPTLMEAMEGDPSPGSWLVSCTVHWIISAAALTFFLLWNESQIHNASKGKKTTPKKMS